MQIISLVNYATAPAPTFYLPHDLVRKNLREGQLVKVVFKNRSTYDERMWVQITHVMPEGVYAGQLRNDPMFTPMEYGDSVTFEWQNVIDVAD